MKIAYFFNPEVKLTVDQTSGQCSIRFEWGASYNGRAVDADTYDPIPVDSPLILRAKQNDRYGPLLLDELWRAGIVPTSGVTYPIPIPNGWLRTPVEVIEEARSHLARITDEA